jgi:hypothetical protein
MQDAIKGILIEVNAGRFREAGALIERGMASDPTALGPYGVNLANWLVLAANWPLVSRLLVPGTNFFLESGWLESLKQAKPVSKDGAPIPWYTYPAIEFIEPRIGRDMRVFEYGSGWSTLWWAERVAEVFSVEHDTAWSALVQPRLPANARVALRTEADRYVGEIETSGGEFDIVVVDGEHRNKCARAAAARVKPTGAIVFDNSDRVSFADGVRYLSDAGWLRIDFFGLIPCYAYKNCTSIFFRDTGWLTGAPVPAEQRSSVGLSCSQAISE